MAAQVTFLSYLWLQILMDTFLDCPEIVLKTVSYCKWKKQRQTKKAPQVSKRKNRPLTGHELLTGDE